MDSDSPINFPPAAKQMAQREVRFQRVVIDFRHSDEELECLIGLLV